MTGPRKPGGERSAEGFADGEVEEAEACEKNSHGYSSTVVPGKTEGLRIKNAHRAKCACNTPLAGVRVNGGIQKTVNTASAKGRNHKRAVAEGLAAANNPISIKIELDAAGKPHPYVADGLSGGGSKRDNIVAMKTGVNFTCREFSHREKARLDRRKVVSRSANNNVEDCTGVGLWDFARDVGFVDVPDIPIH